MFDFGLNPEQEAQANSLHNELIVIDMLTESSFPDNLFQDMSEGGLTCGSFTIGAMGLRHFVNGTLPTEEDWWSWETTCRDLGVFGQVFEDASNRIVPVRSVGDIRQAKTDGNVGIMLNTQNAICISLNLDNIDMFHGMGLRVMQLTYNLQNYLGSGCLEDAANKLSNLGIQAVGRMNEAGMLVDTGHTGDGTIKHAVDVSDKPISCSHAGLAALSKDGNPELYVMDLESRRVTRLTRTRFAAEASPSWSPDGKQIVYVSDRSGSPHLYVTSARGGEHRRLTFHGSESVGPDWGPGGEIVYCSRRDRRYQIRIIDPATREDVAVQHGSGDHEDPSWAPDGRHIVCTRTVQYVPALYVLDALGDPPVRLITLSGDWYSSAWSSK